MKAWQNLIGWQLPCLSPIEKKSVMSRSEPKGLWNSSRSLLD